jgi:hypothetical protein
MPTETDLPALPGFRVLSLLGRGGCGAVYLAIQESLNRKVALKLLLPDHLASAPDRRRFRQEAKLLAGLAHPYVMRVLGHGEAGGLHYIALEYLEGGTLRQKLEQARDAGQRGLASVEVVRLARELLDALVTLHEASVVHRDIKPANVLFRATGDAVLSDLGIAKVNRNDVTAVTATGQLVGTLAYLPPETFDGKPAGPRGDLFSLGVMLFEALIGYHPTRFRPFQIAGNVGDPATLVPGAPRALTALISALISVDPDRRPESAAAALARLAPIGAGPPTRAQRLEVGDDDGPTLPSATSPPSLPPEPRLARRWLPRGGLLGALAAITVALLGVAAFVKPAAPPPVRPALRVHGVEGRGDALAVWLSATHPLEISAPGTTIGTDPVRVALGAQAGGEVANLTVRLPGDARAELSFALPKSRRPATGQRLAELGVAAPLSPAIPRMGDDAEAPLLTDWVAERGLGWFAVLPDQTGVTQLDPAVHERLAKRGVRSFVTLRVIAPPGESRIEAGLARLAALPRGRPLVTFQDIEWDATDGEIAWETVPAMIGRWRSFLSGRHPQFELVAPPVYALSIVEKPFPEANPAGRPDIMLMSQFKEDADYWDSRLSDLRRIFGDRFSPSSVRWVWVGHWRNAVEAFSDRYAGLDEPALPSASRSFVLARRHFPAAAMLTDLRSVAHRKTGAPSRAWQRLEPIAARMAGTTFERSAPLPGRGYAFTFRDEDRVLHALLSDRGGARSESPVFRPRNAGVTLRFGEPPRLTASHDPVALEPGSVPLLYEELAPVKATVRPPDALRLIAP